MTVNLLELKDVTLTKSGILIVVTDAKGNKAVISRFVWDDLAKTVNELFESEKSQAHIAVKDLQFDNS
jgi:accessory colonization factor AcfC